MYRFLLCSLIVLCFTACQKDEPITSAAKFGNGLFFVNEGQFQNANASLSFYDAVNDTIFSKAYETINNQPIGDILQSIAFDDDNIYLVVNNSGKIIVADKKTLNFKGEITGLPSPRYMEYSGNGHLWFVSNLLNDSLFVVNTANYTIESKEYLTTSVEAMKVVGNKLYLSSLSTDRLIIKDLNSGAVDSLNVGTGGNSLAVDNNNNLWLLCNGDFYTPGSAALYKLNTNNFDVNMHTLEPEIEIPVGYPTALTYSSSENTLYFINNGIQAINLDAANNEPEIFIETTTQNFYGIDVIGESIYVSDAVDFTQNGFIYEYNTAGELLKTLSAGINPNAVVSTP